MCETCKLPTASLRAPNRHPSFYSQSHRTLIDDAKLVLSRMRQNTTECNRMRQNATKCNENSCPPARAHARGNYGTPEIPEEPEERARGNGVPFPFSRHGLRPDRNGLRPDRRGSDSTSFPRVSSFPHPRTSLPHTPTSFPRRRGSIAPRPQRIRRIARSCRPRNRPVNKSNEPRILTLGRRADDCATIRAPEHTTEEIRA